MNQERKNTIIINMRSGREHIITDPTDIKKKKIRGNYDRFYATKFDTLGIEQTP